VSMHRKPHDLLLRDAPHEGDLSVVRQFHAYGTTLRCNEQSPRGAVISSPTYYLLSTDYSSTAVNYQSSAERGSALLITMIVITILGTIAFGIGASTVSSLRRQSQIEDSQNAYQAAQLSVLALSAKGRE